MMKMSRFVVLSALVGLLALAAGIVSAETPNFTITIPKISAPTIDGDLSDAAWLEASQKGGKVVVDQHHQGVAISQYPRVAYIGYDESAVYVAFVIYSPDPSKLVGDSPNWWDNDEVEIFLEPGKAGSYTQIGVTSAGAIAPDGVKAAVKKEGIRLTIEVAIPYSVLGADAPKVGDKWGLNLNGHQVADGDMWVCWNPTYGGFHNAARFATAIFGE